MPIISVVIPVYNGEKTIQETIDSVLKQSFGDFELLVINDGSTDETLEIISNIRDERLKVFSYANAGLAASRNRGTSLATGEYISFIDADDLWTPDKLELQLKALQEHPEAAVAYSWTDCINESGNFIYIGSHLSVNGNVYANLLLSNFLDSGSNAFIRSSALKVVGGFDGSLNPCEDWDMWLRLATKYHFVAVPKVQVMYRISANSMSANLVKMAKKNLEVIERNCDYTNPNLQKIAYLSKGNIYKFLVFKALDLTPKPERAWLAVKFLRQAIQYDPKLLRTKAIWKVLLRTATVAFLPSQLAQATIKKFGNLYNIESLLIHLQKYIPLESQ